MGTEPPGQGARGESFPLTFSIPPDPARYEKQLHAIMEIGLAVSSTLHVDLLLPRIIQKVSEIIKAERSTFFVVDRNKGELWSKVVQGGQRAEIRLKVGEGVAGWVAETGQVLNLSDAYADPRFDRTWDERSGYRTRSLVCVPVHDREMSVVGAIQCLNKQGRRRFDEEDEELLRCVSGQCAIALEHAFLYESLLSRNKALQSAEARLRRANAELEVLYDLERQISEAADLGVLLADVVQRMCVLLKVEAGAILLAGESSSQLFAHGVDGQNAASIDLDRTSELLAGVTGPTYEHAGSAAVPPARVLPEGAVREVVEVFRAPLANAHGTIGLIELVNRSDEEASTEWLLRMVALLANQIARGVAVKRDREADERASRLALLGHSMSAVLHDMRTPMTAVGGYAELMAAEDDPQLRTDYVARIGRALAHMETMTQEVLAFARGKRDVLIQRVYMDRFVASVRELLVPETQRYGVDLVIDTRYEGIARFDESKIKRVIFNLARNACQAMGSGGTFTWRVALEGDLLIFECADTGPGISPEMEGKLFESFASHGKSDGTGLGLAMAKKIVDAHEGTIECLSQPGKGATFRITIPC